MSDHLRITDTTLRDGSHAMAHQFTEEQVRATVHALDAAGVEVIEELVRHGVAAVAQRGVGDAQVIAHAGTPAARRSPMTSPTWAAAEVMMSRLPAYSGR